MKKQEIQSLVDRWETPEFADARTVVEAIIVGREAPEANPLRTEEGRLDFRGIVVPDYSLDPWNLRSQLPLLDDSSTTPRYFWQHTTFQGADFTAATLLRWAFIDCRLDDCVFDHANCYGLDFRTSQVSNSSFRRADLRTSLLGVMDDNIPDVWTTVDFTRADIRDGSFYDSNYRNITFDNARLDRANFSGSAFDDCTFAGRLKKVFFVGKPPHDSNKQHDYWMHNVDLRRTIWDDSLLVNYELDTVTLPDDVTVIHNTSDTFARAADHIEHHLADQPEADRTMRILRNSGAGPKWTTGTYVVKLDDFSPPIAHLIRTALQATTT